MTRSRVAFVQWPDSLQPRGAAWDQIQNTVERARADILVTNEMPFGPWLAEAAEFDLSAAARSAELHEAALVALKNLQVGAVVSSRPILEGDCLSNEAYVLERGSILPLHRKRYFPEETGWYEESWFQRGAPDRYSSVEVQGLRVGVLLCTELFFNEHARAYGREGADIIVVPRASGRSVRLWEMAGAMASAVAGTYLVSSNRTGTTRGSLDFGGYGFALDPNGEHLAHTSDAQPLCTVDVDTGITQAQKLAYPCYVKD